MWGKRALQPGFVVWIVCFALSCGGGAGGSATQDVHLSSPDTPPIEPVNLQVSLINNRVHAVDTKTGYKVINPIYTTGHPNVGTPVFEGDHTINELQPSLDIHPVSNGYDLEYHFSNTTGSPKRLGRLRFGNAALGTSISYRDFGHINRPIPTTSDTYICQARLYPAAWYSPVMVLEGEKYTVGVSIQYPMMEYKHDLRWMMINRGIEDEGLVGWEVEFRLQNLGDEGQFDRLQDNFIPAGANWTYTMSVRVVNKGDDWLKTLIPYRDFFRATYGGVQYERQTDPIRGETCSMQGSTSDSNPFGYVYESLRPDLNGWGPWANRIINQMQGWNTVLLWKPTGSYRVYLYGNMSFLFMSRLRDEPLTANVDDPDVGLPRVAQAGKTLGLWWGHSATVAMCWDCPTMASLDPENSDHRTRAFAELDYAVSAGARLIGLDSYNHWFAPIWKLYPWLVEMRARHPEVKFCAESIACDVLHTLAASYVEGTHMGIVPATPEDLRAIKNPYYMADFLLPGHETWAAYHFGPYTSFFGYPTQDQVRAEIANYAAMGFRTIVFLTTETSLVPGPDIMAAESWNFSIPPSLRNP